MPPWPTKRWRSLKSRSPNRKSIKPRPNWNKRKINLDYTTINSPVSGTIIDRRVNIGQTVVASLNAPSLFLIAKDLKKMQIWASVNEADMGQIHLDQDVQFTVDAVPDRTFNGKVIQTRNNAAMTQNVVTYTVVISVDNSDGKLRPYQTANVQFDAGKHDNVLLGAESRAALAAAAAASPPGRPRGLCEATKGPPTPHRPGRPAARRKAPDLKAEKDRRERGTLVGRRRPVRPRRAGQDRRLRRRRDGDRVGRRQRRRSGRDRRRTQRRRQRRHHQSICSETVPEERLSGRGDAVSQAF